MDQACRVVPFSSFRTVVRELCGADQDWAPPRQVTYLDSYLANVPGREARSLVVERPYIDRHYLEEYTAYYATVLRPPSSQAGRVHVFARDLSDQTLGELIQRAAGGEYADVCSDLQRDYLGFVTVRPIPGAPIGRTLLVHYGESDGKLYGPAVHHCTSRVLGLELDFEALPFQQQDQGVGACASAALWSALAKVCREAGMRAPTPYTVTAAATKNWLTDRAVPAVSGLELGQLANAVRELGFAPYHVKVDEHPELFLWTLQVYLRSGIPAVLVVRDREVHAVAVAGYKEATGDLLSISEEPRALRFRALKRIYVHDDRIGPYVKMALWAEQVDEHHDIRLCRVPVDDPGDAKLMPDTRVNYAIYPLYPKLRLTAVDMAKLAAQMAPLFRHLVTGERAAGLSVDAWFCQNGVYLRQLYEIGADAERVEKFVRSTTLSRYVGVIRWLLDGDAVADVVCDTTDIGREETPYAPVIAIFFFDRKHAERASTSANAVIPGAAMF